MSPGGKHVVGAAREAWELISDFFWSDEAHERFHRAGEALDVSPPMLKLLLGLEPGEPRTMGGLAEQVRCDASWMTSLVDGLEEHGFVARRVLPSDRRVKTVVLTDRGVEAQQRVFDILHEPPSSFDRLSATEARRLRDLLRKVSAPSDDTASEAAAS